MTDASPFLETPPVLTTEYLGEVDALANGKSFWENRASAMRQTDQRHVGYSDAAGAGGAEKRDRLKALLVLFTVIYAGVVGLVIAGLNLPIGWTWLGATAIAALVFAGVRTMLTRRA